MDDRSFSDEGIDPFDVDRFDHLSSLRLFLPGLVVDHEENEIGKISVGLERGYGPETELL